MLADSMADMACHPPLDRKQDCVAGQCRREQKAWAVAHLAGRHGYAAGNGGQEGHLGAQKCLQAPPAANLHAHLPLTIIEHKRTVRVG